MLRQIGGGTYDRRYAADELFTLIEAYERLVAHPDDDRARMLILSLMSLAPGGHQTDDGFMAIEWRERIKRVPGVRSGQPIIRGLRITVKDVLGFLASGMTVAEILHDFPELEEADIHAALAYAAENLSDSSPA